MFQSLISVIVRAHRRGKLSGDLRGRGKGSQASSEGQVTFLWVHWRHPEGEHACPENGKSRVAGQTWLGATVLGLDPGFSNLLSSSVTQDDLLHFHSTLSLLA